MKMRMGALSIAATLAVALMGAGCGGGDGDGGGSDASATASDGGSLSKAEYIRAADFICANGAERSEAEFGEFVRDKAIPDGQVPSTEQFAEVGVQILIPSFRRQVDELRELGPAPGDPETVESYLSGLEEVVAEVEADPELAKSPPKLLVETDKLAQEYGFKTCGNR